MSIEELEEILNKNKFKNNRNTEKDEHNNSYYSQRNNSVTETSKVFNKLNDKLEKIKVDPVNSSFSPLNIFHKNYWFNCIRSQSFFFALTICQNVILRSFAINSR